MRQSKYILSFIIGCFFFFQYEIVAQTHWDYNIVCRYTIDSLFISAELKAPVQEEKFTLLFSPLANIQEVKLKQGKDFSAVPYSRKANSDSLFIDLSKISKESSSNKTLCFKYSLPVKSFVFPTSKYSFTLRREHRWYPLLYDTPINSTLKILSQDASVYFYSNGKKIQNGDTTTFQAKNSLSIPIIAVSKLTSNEYYAELNNVRLIFNFSSVDSLQIARCMKRTQNSFKFYTQLLGNLNDEEFYFIEIPSDHFNIAQTLQNILFFGNYYIDSLTESQTWLEHEIAHFWNGAKRQYKQNDTLRHFYEETLTQFLSYYACSKLSPQKNLKKSIQVEIEKIPQAMCDSTLTPLKIKKIQTPQEAMYIYRTAVFAFFDLYNCLGETQWQKLIKSYINSGTDFMDLIKQYDLHCYQIFRKEVGYRL